MFAIICLLISVVSLSMCLACVEVKARGWWVWALTCGYFLYEFVQQIGS